MALLDHNGESEFPFSKDEVFEALCSAIPSISGMKIESADKLMGRVMVKAGVSLASWGENIPIQLSSISERLTKVKITSSPKTGIMLGGAFDMGKSRKNIEDILLATSKKLSNPTVADVATNYHNSQPNFTLAGSKWYDKTWLVTILCIIFFPIGLYALWKSNNVKTGWKVAWSIIIGLVVIASISDKDERTSDNSSETNSSATTKPSFTQAQKDSLAELERQNEEQRRKEQTISAGNLIANYTQNEVSADENFKGKHFYVVGYIDDIGKDLLDDIYVTLSTGDDFRRVQCFIDDKVAVAQLQKGQKITIYGQCDGLMMNVLMKNCELVDNLKD
jgi:hypothetical protein